MRWVAVMGGCGADEDEAEARVGEEVFSAKGLGTIESPRPQSGMGLHARTPFP